MDFNNILAVAKRLISENGKTITIVTAVRTEVNEQGDVAETGTAHEVKGVLSYHDTLLYEGTLIQRADRTVLVAAKDLGFEPRQGDDIYFGGGANYEDFEKEEITWVRSIYAGENPAVYELHVKG